MGYLTAEQLQSYKDNGYIVLKNLFSEKEMSRIIDEYDKLFKRKNLENMENSWVGVQEENRISDSPYTVKGVHNLPHHHAVFSKMLYNEDMLDAVEEIMGTGNIMLHHTKAHYKVAGNGAAYPMHQDYHYFPYAKDSCVAVFIHIDAADPENGGLCVYPGSHKLGVLEDIGQLEGNYHYMDQKIWSFEKATPVIAEQGDVVIFSYMLVHGSPPNFSDRPRRMLLAQFLGADNKPTRIQPLQPGYGWMLRGVNLDKDAATNKHFEP